MDGVCVRGIFTLHLPRHDLARAGPLQRRVPPDKSVAAAAASRGRASNSSSPYQAHFNKCMSTVRQAVEWGFGKVAAGFAFVDFHKNSKVTRQKMRRMHKVAILLTNCRTCLYDSQVSMYFGLEPPSLSDYLFPFN
ncbi:hypothetical protein MRX96_036908 [Rhipicephalus microplus]